MYSKRKKEQPGMLNQLMNQGLNVVSCSDVLMYSNGTSPYIFYY